MRLFMFAVSLMILGACGQMNDSNVQHVTFKQQKRTRSINIKPQLNDDLVVTRVYQRSQKTWDNRTIAHPYAFDVRLRQGDGAANTAFNRAHRWLAEFFGREKVVLEKTGTITVQFRAMNDKGAIPDLKVNTHITSLTVCAKPATSGQLNTLWVKSIKLANGASFKRLFTACYTAEIEGHLGGEALTPNDLQTVETMN